MPRYFFHTYTGEAIIDTIGTVIADLQQAKVEAVRTAVVSLQGRDSTEWNGNGWRMDVTDAKGAVFLRPGFSADDKTPPAFHNDR